jgi:hypothetical protein
VRCWGEGPSRLALLVDEQEAADYQALTDACSETVLRALAEEADPL